MSETKGRIGYTIDSPDSTVFPRPSLRHKKEVWIIPLDPDGPKPGETWMSERGPVTVLAPDSDPDYSGWYCRDEHGERVLVRAGDLSPIPKTRTVTVELTEEEVENARDALEKTRRMYPSDPYDKLLAALEDE